MRVICEVMYGGVLITYFPELGGKSQDTKEDLKLHTSQKTNFESQNQIQEPPQNATNEERIIRFLKYNDSQSPKNMQDTLGIPKTTAYRCLRRLTDKQLVLSTGRTKSVRFQLIEQQNEN